MRIAMWSGPRNLSTAMMYAFGERADFAAWDEPFYAPYLAVSGQEHPLRDTILQSHDSDPDSVASRCSGPIPNDRPHFYMKHMPHHMLAGFPLEWASDCVNIHLIRHPARVIQSYAAKREDFTMCDIGFEDQTRIFEAIDGPVVDSADIRQNPKRALARLSAEIGLSFDPSMLEWPAGPKPYDGAWAAHWYGAVHRSTSFAGPEGDLPIVSDRWQDLLNDALPHYEDMRARALTI